MRLFNKLRKQATKDVILNKGLGMAMEFGGNWLKPIEDRLENKYPFLTKMELADYNNICRQAMQQGHAYVYDTLSKVADLNNTIKNDVLKRDFNQFMKSQFDWVGDEQLKILFGQSCYYAWKEGLDKAIVG